MGEHGGTDSFWRRLLLEADDRDIAAVYYAICQRKGIDVYLTRWSPQDLAYIKREAEQW